MGGNLRIFAFDLYFSNTVKNPIAGRPKLDLFQQPKKIHMFSIKPFIAAIAHPCPHLASLL